MFDFQYSVINMSNNLNILSKLLDIGYKFYLHLSTDLFTMCIFYNNVCMTNVRQY